MSLALTIVAGGERLDDTLLLRADTGISKLALSAIPAANTIGDFRLKTDQFRVTEKVRFFKNLKIIEFKKIF